MGSAGGEANWHRTSVFGFHGSGGSLWLTAVDFYRPLSGKPPLHSVGRGTSQLPGGIPCPVLPVP